MIPVTQRIVRDPGPGRPSEERGDCLRATVASIMERDLDDVPHFCDTGLERPGNKRVWAYALMGWFFANGVIMDHREVLDDQALPHSGIPGYCILSGPGPRGVRHSVVGYQGHIVHDPHPSHEGLVSVDEIEILVPINDHAAALLARRPEAMGECL